MAGELRIKSGAKLRLALDVPVGKEPEFNLVCTFVKSLDSASFLISVPMCGGRPLPLDDQQKLLICYGNEVNSMIVAGYADALVKEGIRHCWKIRRVSEHRQFFQRADERLKVTIPIRYSIPTWQPDADGMIPWEEGMTLDISSGGMAAYLNRSLTVGEVCDLTLPAIGTAKGGQTVSNLVAAVCWTREAPKGSAFRFICGYQFRFADGIERQQVQEYVANIKRRYKL